MSLFNFKLDPELSRRFRRFRTIKRGYYSLILIIIMVFLSLIGELWINNKALIVKYEGQYYFPTYSQVYSGQTFGKDYAYEAKYRELKKEWEEAGSDNFVIMPLIPFSEYENDLIEGEFPPFPPDWKTGHYLGTDDSGRDIAARLVFGFRIAVGFAILVVFLSYFIGIAIGCAQGFFGGVFDLVAQRAEEIISTLPFLYLIMIIAVFVPPSFWSLLVIYVALQWIGIAYYMRTETYKEREKDYTKAAIAMGASSHRIVFKHILPNTMSVIVTFAPFAFLSAIVSLSALDFLGFGFPPPTPSWGELLSQGFNYITDAQWIMISVVTTMVIVLTMVTFVGEALREAFDPKKFTVYEG